uniref:YhfC family intramembrane metalloprotease n=1 Tax=candidate division WOR-3 bacterium TaxID=2052148 RepID=A0A7C4U8G5_UNCW3
MRYILTLGHIGMILVGIAFILYWYYKKKISFKFFLWGSLVWIVAVFLKFAFARLVSKELITFLRDHLSSFLSEPIIWIYTGILTGIFECGIILLFSFIKRIKESNYDESIGFGIGFGSVEAIILGFSALITFLMVLLFPEKLPNGFAEQLLSSLPHPSTVFGPIIERISAMFIHISSSVLIITSVKLKKQGWFWISFIYKTIVDSYAAYFLYSKKLERMNVTGYYLFEFTILLLGVIGIFILIKLKKFFK